MIHITQYMTHIVSVHCREEGCIGKYIPRGPRNFPRAGILHPEAREIGLSQCFIKFWLKILWFLIAKSSPTKEIFCFSHSLYWGVSICIALHQNNFYQPLFIMLRIWASLTAIALTYCLPATYHQWATLHHCWSIVNVFRARMCSQYSP